MEKRTLKNWKIFAFILIALNITLIVILIMGRPGNRPGGGEPGKFIVEKLKLTREQETEFSKLRISHHDSIMKLQEEGRKLRKSFLEGLKVTVPDMNKDSIVNKIAENQRKIELVTYHHFEEVKKICTPEQKLIFNDIMMDVIRKIENPPPPEGNRDRPKE